MDDLEQIRQLKYRYLRTLDTKQWDEFGECFVPDAVGRYAGLDLDGRDTIVDYMRENLGAGIVTLHQCHHPELVVSGDEASGVWYLQDKVIVPDFRFVLEGAAFYDDRYVRTPQGWRIARTGYRRTYEMTWSMDDAPSLKVTLDPTH
ncbi:nuclear transport factor 2 family protein [Nocardioides sp.]|uniref:nuclear transport factor 2 family protein n=1 Tax=Nocardioides sp. TaxID=35761 RepID=UPI002734464E|nr:nuclear transport factor 2 family protein [Nocardioides sp.]MDP3889597.1 nuclear transport factor 2 family protein [Nocardioides sp.]